MAEKCESDEPSHMFPMAAMRERVKALRQWEATLSAENGFADALEYALDELASIQAEVRRLHQLGVPSGKEIFNGREV